MATEKRARKKAVRDQKVAAYQAELRRRRMIRLGVALAVLVGITVLAFVRGGEDEPTTPAAGDSPAASAEPTAEATEPAPGDAEAAACGAEPPAAAKSKQYKKPEQVTDAGVDYAAVIETSCGTIEVDLLEDKAPDTVNNFVFLANEGYYDGLTWHRIEPEFVIQGGDPVGDGTGGPGYSFKDELPEKSNEYVYGTVAMANSGPNTNGSQFFIVIHDFAGAQEGKPEPAGLDPLYSIFGQADPSSYEAIEAIAAVERVEGGSQPLSPVFIESITIIER